MMNRRQFLQGVAATAVATAAAVPVLELLPLMGGEFNINININKMSTESPPVQYWDSHSEVRNPMTNRLFANVTTL